MYGSFFILFHQPFIPNTFCGFEILQPDISLHVFNEDTVAHGWVIHYNVGHGSNKLVILNYRRTTHALDNAAGKLYKPVISNLKLRFLTSPS